MEKKIKKQQSATETTSIPPTEATEAAIAASKVEVSSEANEEKKNASKPPRLRKQTYSKNPFLEEAFPLVKTKTKRITNNKGGLIIKSDTGEIVEQMAGFWTAKQVDSAQFIKLYVNGVKAFSDLTSKGAKVFELMYYEMQKSIGKDQIYLNFATTEKDLIKISKTTFYEGLNELVSKNFLAPVADATHWFWINPDYVWNGDRLTFVQTYIKNKQHSVEEIEDKNNLDTVEKLALENQENKVIPPEEI